MTGNASASVSANALRFYGCPGNRLAWRRGRVAEARDCKSLHMGSIPIVASEEVSDRVCPGRSFVDGSIGSV
jgi:hypothetical protein